jgi:3-hydroxy-5-methyl-1-naphthoate 3-O-methyltransferase
VNPRRRRLEARLRLTRLALGGWAAQALFVATELGIFDHLNRLGPSTAKEIAAELGTDDEATRRLLGALVASGLLEHPGDRFANSDAAQELLISGVPESMYGWIRLMGTWNRTFAGLRESVRTGEPTGSPGGDPSAPRGHMREYILGMHDYAMGPGRELARYLDLGGRTRLLDVGGGPGTYAILLAEKNPELTAVVFDLPEVVAIAEEVIADHGLAGRVTVHPGDYTADPIPGGFDAVLISNTLHQEDEATCVRILEKTREALEPGGICVIHAMPLNETEDGPLWPSLLNLMLQVVSRGKAYTVAEYAEQLTRAGFTDPAPGTMSTHNAGLFIVGHRP